MWIVSSETGGGTDLQFRPRFFFENEADARAAARKLNNAGTSALALATQQPRRRAPFPIYDQRLAAAMEVLQAMDEDAEASTLYHVHEVVPFVTPVDGAPTSNDQVLFRAIRDLG